MYFDGTKGLQRRRFCGVYGAKPPRPEWSERLKSVNISAYKVFVIYQRVVIAVATATVFLAEPSHDISFAIVAVIFIGNLYP